MEEALVYFHEVNLFLYYPEVLSDTIFVNRMVVINSITQLYEYHCDLEGSPEAEIKSEGDLRYLKQALFTRDHLASLHTNYSKVTFPDDDLVKLLQSRLIIAEMPFLINGQVCYMMPSLLTAIEEEDIIRPQFVVASPLLVMFPNEAPVGLFCALVVELLTSNQWKIAVIMSGNISELKKNYLEFSLPNDQGMVTLVNTMKQFELHPSSSLPSKLLPTIWQTIDQSLKTVCSRLSYKVLHQFAFQCNCGLHPHAALISVDKSATICSLDPENVQPLSEKQKQWVLLCSNIGR